MKSKFICGNRAVKRKSIRESKAVRSEVKERVMNPKSSAPESTFSLSVRAWMEKVITAHSSAQCSDPKGK